MKYLLLLILIVNAGWSTDNSEQNDYDTTLILLAQAKMAGVCGTIKQMALFQESTKMAGGDEFLARYINTEMARLNLTSETFLKLCKQSVQTYEQTVNTMEQMQNEERRKLFEKADKIIGHK